MVEDDDDDGVEIYYPAVAALSSVVLIKSLLGLYSTLS